MISYVSNMSSPGERDDQILAGPKEQLTNSPSDCSSQKTNSQHNNLNAALNEQRNLATGKRRDSKDETTASRMREDDDVTCLLSSEDATRKDISKQESTKFPFSSTRVWIFSTIIIVCYIVVYISMIPISSQYLYNRFAKDHFNLTVNSTNSKKNCANSSSVDGSAMNKAQKEASSTILYSTLASSIPAFFTCLIAGSISDFLGRKFLMVLALSGTIIKVVLLGLVIKLDLAIPILYIGSFIDGAMGSVFVTTIAITSIIADITLEGNNKAVRFAIFEGIILVCTALSQMGIGYLIQAVGYFVPVLICACLLFVVLLVAVFLLPETLRNKQKFTWNIATHIKKTFGFYLSDKTWKGQRRQFIVGLAISSVLTFISTGKGSIETIFVLNRPICWSSVEIGVFGASRMVVASLAAVILIKVCKHRLSLELIGVICSISSTAGLIVEGFANSTFLMYLSALVGIFSTASLPLPKALLSQIASNSAQGALFSSMACVDTVSTMVSSTLYLLIYNATLETMRGAAFIVMAGMCSMGIVLFMVYRHLRLANIVPYEFLIKKTEAMPQSYQRTSQESECEVNKT